MYHTVHFQSHTQSLKSVRSAVCVLVSAGESLQERAAAAANHRRLSRNRRNISWYKNHSDFWAWYKYFTDNGNQEAVSTFSTQLKD